MASLLECLAKTKFRVFKVGDRIVHSTDPNTIYVIESFCSSARERMKLKEVKEGSWREFSATFWSKVK